LKHLKNLYLPYKQSPGGHDEISVVLVGEVGEQRCKGAEDSLKQTEYKIEVASF
jgi:hypothetical protein